MTSSAPPPPGDASASEPRQDGMRGTPRRRVTGRAVERTLFTEPVLIVSREPSSAGPGRGYGVFDRDGSRIGGVTVTTPGFLSRAVQRLWKSGRYVGRKFQVRDADQSTVLKVSERAKGPRGTRFVVTRADETPIGEILSADTESRHFTLLADDRPIATMVATGRQAREILIKDQTGTDVARVGRPAAAVSPISGNACLVEIPRQVSEPLASMIIATTLTIGDALTTPPG
ncbi:hypothetical protein [Amycolatopsis jejuensis]|uniref:hypothetical protein n=1 Tax=Amycolatopsis jejuensis TaxID=330084 RepID=UPI001FE1BE88|nr:hypothetical protein [Amycolatopsis jejuensis]